MKIETKQTFELSIILDRSEAEWLSTYMREAKSKNESIVDKDLRERLFTKIDERLRR